MLGAKLIVGNQLCADYRLLNQNHTESNTSTLLDLDTVIGAPPGPAFETYKLRHDGELNARYQLYPEDAWW